MWSGVGTSTVKVAALTDTGVRCKHLAPDWSRQGIPVDRAWGGWVRLHDEGRGMGLERGVPCVGVRKTYASGERTSQNSCTEKHTHFIGIVGDSRRAQGRNKALLGILGWVIGTLWETGLVSFPASSEAPYPLRFHPIFAVGLRIPLKPVIWHPINICKHSPRKHQDQEKEAWSLSSLRLRSPYRMTKSALLAANLERLRILRPNMAFYGSEWVHRAKTRHLASQMCLHRH